MPLPRPRPPVRRAVAAGAVVGAAALSLRVLARPLPVAERRLLDWDQVRRVAHRRSGERGGLDEERARRLGAEYDAMARELAPLMAQACGVDAQGFPPFTVLDRHAFVDRNLVIVQRLFDPVERLRAQIPESRATALGRAALSRYVGELFGFLAQRVLGQYDPVLLLAPRALAEQAPETLREATALYLVEPNVESFERRSGAPSQTLRRWLVLHELTHAWQFEAHPWLRSHLGGLMHGLLMNEVVQRLTAGDGGPPPRGASLQALRAMPNVLRLQLRTVMEVQAIMSVCEGYSNFVMHRVGAEHLQDFARLERAFHERSAKRPPLERLVLRATGLSMKMRQYEIGERFAETVSARGGTALLNRVWDGPECMPSWDEVRNPGAWLRRMEVR